MPLHNVKGTLAALYHIVEKAVKELRSFSKDVCPTFNLLGSGHLIVKHPITGPTITVTSRKPTMFDHSVYREDIPTSRFYTYSGAKKSSFIDL